MRCCFSCALIVSQLASTASGVSRLDVGEDVGVPAHELVDEPACDVVDVERLARVLLGDAGLEGDLEQQVAQLLPHVVGVAALDGLDRLVGLLEEVGHEAGVGLLGVPRAAPGRAQPVHDRDDVEQAGAGHVEGADEHLDVGGLGQPASPRRRSASLRPGSPSAEPIHTTVAGRRGG